MECGLPDGGPEQTRARGKETQIQDGLRLVTTYRHRSISHGKCATLTTSAVGDEGVGVGIALYHVTVFM